MYAYDCFCCDSVLLCCEVSFSLVKHIHKINKSACMHPYNSAVKRCIFKIRNHVVLLLDFVSDTIEPQRCKKITLPNFFRMLWLLPTPHNKSLVNTILLSHSTMYAQKNPIIHQSFILFTQEPCDRDQIRLILDFEQKNNLIPRKEWR